jgi:cobalamin biosynthesis protein CbiG
MPLGTMKEVDLASGHKGSTELTNQYAKLVGSDIPTKMDTSTKGINMIRSKHIINGNDKLIRKVNLMKANKSQGIDNSLNKEKSTCLKNQDIMIIQNGVAN